MTTEKPRTVSIFYHGAPVSMKNSRVLGVKWVDGRPRAFSRRSADCQKWMQDVDRQTPGNLRLRLGSPSRPVRLTATVWYKDRRPDLDIEALCDALEDAGVLSNDRHVYEKHSYKRFSRSTPGVEVLIEEIAPIPADD